MISEKLSTDSRRMLQNGVPQFVGFCRCTPCRQRRGKAPRISTRAAAAGMHPVQAAPRQRGQQYRHAERDAMHPVQAAPRQSDKAARTDEDERDAPRAGSAEAKNRLFRAGSACGGCTPCRQRRGKVKSDAGASGVLAMHPVQAAPRQSHPDSPC